MENQWMMMIVCYVVLSVVITPVVSLHIEEGCEAKSKWKVKYVWPENNFSVWVPHQENSEFLTITIEFADHGFPVTYDIFHFFKDHVHFRKFRETKEVFSTQTNMSISDGWANFYFNADVLYSLNYVNTNTNFTGNASVDFLISSVDIEGSNVTVNCKSDKRTWKSAKQTVSMPLDELEIHWLSFYSTMTHLPEFQLLGRSFILGYNNGSLTTIPGKAQPLPAFKEFHLMLGCKKSTEAYCKIMVGENRRETENVLLVDIPDSIRFTGKQCNSYYVTFHSHDPLRPGQSTQMAANDYFVWKVVAIAAIAIISIWIVVKVVHPKLLHWTILVKDKFKKKSPYEVAAQTDNSA